MIKAFKDGLETFQTIFTGMGITMRHMFRPAVTIQYPEERDVLPDNARSKLYVNIDDCIGCNLCARACPVNCIDIETVVATSDVDLGKTSTGNPKRFWLTRFDIDMSKCMYCDLCVPPCPTDCIFMVPEYEYSEYDRNDLVFHFSNLKPDMVAEVKEKAEKEAEEKKRQKEEMARKQAEAKKMKEKEATEKAAADSSGGTGKEKSSGIVKDDKAISGSDKTEDISAGVEKAEGKTSGPGKTGGKSAGPGNTEEKSAGSAKDEIKSSQTTGTGKNLPGTDEAPEIPSGARQSETDPSNPENDKS